MYLSGSPKGKNKSKTQLQALHASAENWQLFLLISFLKGAHVCFQDMGVLGSFSGISLLPLSLEE